MSSEIMKKMATAMIWEWQSSHVILCFIQYPSRSGCRAKIVHLTPAYLRLLWIITEELADIFDIINFFFCFVSIQYLPDSGGPREPWHDWHCKIEGHAAYDVLTNFEQRWKKATRLHDEELLDFDRRENLMSPSNRAPISGDPALFLYNDLDSETWTVQVG